MPSAIYYSHKITKVLSTASHSGQDWMGPDGKAQVTIEYSNVNEPVRISNVICSTQHSKDLKDNPSEVQKRVEKISLQTQMAQKAMISIIRLPACNVI